MTLRIRLLALSLLTLALPWAGCEYARQMETVLRAGQEGALLTTAKTLARVIASDSDLVEQTFAEPSATEPRSKKLFAAQLDTTPLLDGLNDEWPQSGRPLPTDSATHNLRLGIYRSALYAFMHVPDSQVRYEIPAGADHPVSIDNDRILLVTRDQSGVEHAWSLSALAPGPVVVRRANTIAPWKPSNDDEAAEIRGIWRETVSGFDVELRIPTRLIGAELALVHLDDALLPPAIELRTLHAASQALRDKLNLYVPEGLRISIVDKEGWLLARAGTVEALSADGSEELPSLYRWFVGRGEQIAPPTYGLPYGMWGPPIDGARAGNSDAIWFQAGGGEPSTVRAAIPIPTAHGILGVIAVEQAGSQLLLDRDAALAGLLQFTLLATVLTVCAAIAFAAWLSRRIRNLSVAAASALSPQGDVDSRLPETSARDELGDLARSYATLLQRFKDYTQYLRTLGSKLSHEFRTPLAIVSSSLENLAAEQDAPSQTYVQRARQGTARLQGILTAMTEATRVEQSIETTERVEFDLADLVRGVGQAYAQTFATHRIELTVPSTPCPFFGAPELVVQMLDKLIDNAVDFCPPRQRITIALSNEPKFYRLTVGNEGPLLAPGTEHKMFDMLVSERTGEDSKPHLGLGLFIVQLIARFHGGFAAGQNKPDLNGVDFEIQLAKRRPAS